MPPPAGVEANLHENEKNAKHEDVTAVPQNKANACGSPSGAHGNQCLLYVRVGRGGDGVAALGDGGGE